MAELGKTTLITSVYKYSCTMQYVNGSEIIEIDPMYIKSIVTDYDYDNNNMPIMFVTFSVSKKVLDKMILNQDSATIIFNLQRTITGEGIADLWTDYIKDTCIYFLTEDINKLNDEDYEGSNADREDILKSTCIGLMSQKLINNNTKNIVSGVINRGNMLSAVYYVTANLPMLIEPFTYNKSLSKIFLPPMNSVSKAIKYLNNISVFYDTSYRFFMDFDTTYLLSSTGNAIPKRTEQISNVIITLQKNYVMDSKEQGMVIDTTAGAYKLVAAGTDMQLSDNHATDKSYNKIYATTTKAESTNADVSTISSATKNVATKASRIRVANDNVGILNNIESDIKNSAIQLLISKTDLDSAIFTINKKYTINAENVYGDTTYNGTYLLSRKRELLLREDDTFTNGTMLLFRKVMY